MQKFLLGLLLALICSPLFGQAKPPEVDSAEVMRRGDMVVVAGEGPRSDADEAFLMAMAPPPDDSHKWFITVFSMKNCPACEALKRDFRDAPELLSFVTAPEEAKAWAHYNEYSIDDQTQAFRVKAYRMKFYPTIVVQPPRNGMWGDPRTVVYQTSGYDSKPNKLADLIRDAVRKYSAKMSEQGYPRQPVQERDASLTQRLLHLASVGDSVVVGGARQSEEKPIGVDPPFVTPTRPDPFNPQQPYQPAPNFPATWPPVNPPPAPAPTPAEPTNPGGGLLTTLLAGFASIVSALLLIMKVLEFVAPKTPTKADDVALLAVRQVVALLQQSGIIQPTQPVPVVPVTPSVPIQAFQPGPALSGKAP